MDIEIKKSPGQNRDFLLKKGKITAKAFAWKNLDATPLL